jgi:hypothetical protein
MRKKYIFGVVVLCLLLANIAILKITWTAISYKYADRIHLIEAAIFDIPVIYRVHVFSDKKLEINTGENGFVMSSQLYSPLGYVLINGLICKPAAESNDLVCSAAPIKSDESKPTDATDNRGE